MKIGVLALQGDFNEHCRILKSLGVEAVEVRKTNQMKHIDGLIIPGGETTTLIKLIHKYGFAKELKKGKIPVYGTCAGAILLADKVSNPKQSSLGMLDVSVERNSYGRQLDSFEADIEIKDFDEPFHAFFIRAPRITKTGNGAKILAKHGRYPVLLKNGNILVSTFHPELTNDTRIHRLFLNMIEQII